MSGDPVSGQQFDHRFFQRRDQHPHAQPQSPHVQQAVNHHLAGAVISDLTAAIRLNDRNIAGGQQMFRLAGQPQGEHRRMFDPPQFIRGVRSAGGGEGLHRRKDRWIVAPAQITGDQRHSGWSNAGGRASCPAAAVVKLTSG